MKTFKKIIFSLGLLIVLASAFTLHSRHASAAVDFSQAFWDGAAYTWVNDDTINVSNGASSITFDNPGGNTFPVGTYHASGEAAGGTHIGLCATPNTITVGSSDIGKASSSGKLSVFFAVTGADSRGNPSSICKGYSRGVTVKNPTAGGTCSYLACSQNDIKSLASTKYSFTDVNTISTTFKGKTINFVDGIPSDDDHTFAAPSGVFCSGGGFDNHGAISINDSDYKKISKSDSTVDGQLDADWYSAAN